MKQVQCIKFDIIFIVPICLFYLAGNTDGLIKGKRYFTCPPKHGKVVRITSVVAVLPNKVS